MKYEKLIRIAAKKTVWPENKVEDFEAYETKAADEAINELMTWYKEADAKAKILEKDLKECKTEAVKNQENYLKELVSLKSTTEQALAEQKSLEWKNKELEKNYNELSNEYNLAKGKLLTADTNYSAIANSLSEATKDFRNMALERDSYKTETDTLKVEVNNKDAKIKELETIIEKLQKKITSTEGTMTKINELVNYYNEWKKSE